MYFAFIYVLRFNEWVLVGESRDRESLESEYGRIGAEIIGW